MHGSIRDRLEDLLAGGRPAALRETAEHLSSCVECSSELQSMQQQSVMMRELREEAEPGPGFYARVMQRIEERAKDSIWAAWIYSPIGKRLAYASLTIAVALGTYVITAEMRDGHLGGERVAIAQNLWGNAEVIGSQSHQRDAVLLNFASYHYASYQGSPQ